MPTGMATDLKERIKSLLKQTGKSARSVSMEATGKPDTIRDILRGKVASPQAETIRKLAAAMDVQAAHLLGEVDMLNPQATTTRDLLQPARVVGLVQAGSFMEIEAESRYDLEPQWIPTVRDPDFPSLEQIAFQIAGDSLDKKCAAGGYAICLPFADTGLPIKAGMYVVAARVRGGLIEHTIKRVEGAQGKFKLVPDSTNPRHKAIHFPSAEADEEVTIVALVRRFISPQLTF